MTRNMRTGSWACWFLAATAAAWASPCQPSAQPPRPGDVQWLTVITLSMQAGSTEKETRQVTYSPPPGWYVRSHRVACTKKYGHSAFSVTTVPRDWGWSSEEKADQASKTLIDVEAKAGSAGGKAKLALNQEQKRSGLRKVRSTHHALIVDATAKGEGFLRGGGGIELTVTAELVFTGTEESPGTANAGKRAPPSKSASAGGPKTPADRP